MRNDLLGVYAVATCTCSHWQLRQSTAEAAVHAASAACDAEAKMHIAMSEQPIQLLLIPQDITCTAAVRCH